LSLLYSTTTTLRRTGNVYNCAMLLTFEFTYRPTNELQNQN